MPSSTFTLTDFTSAALQLGRAEVFYASAWTTTGDLAMTHLGVTEDPIQLEVNPEYSILNLPEHSGPAPIEAYAAGGEPMLEFSIVDASTAIWSLINSVNTKGFGYKRRRSVTEYTLALFPTDLFVTSTGEVDLVYNGASWTKGGSALGDDDQQKLDAALWLWRGWFDPITPLFSHDEGGKAKAPVTFHVMQDFDQPDGQQLFTIGDPADQSIDIHPSS